MAKMINSYRVSVSFYAAGKCLDAKEQVLCGKYPALQTAWEKYVRAYNLWTKYAYNPRPSTGLIAIVMGKNKAFFRHQAKVAFLGRLQKKRWGEFEFLLKLVQDY